MVFVVVYLCELNLQDTRVRCDELGGVKMYHLRHIETSIVLWLHRRTVAV